MSEPLQIIHFKDSGPPRDDCGDIQLNHANLDKILSQTENRPLCIISVCGPSRQGKSFLLGYMIRCLEGLEKDEADWMDWEHRTKPLDGFKFRNGTKPETQGIWVWSKPFLVNVGADETPIAILLVDTQGTYDEFIDARTTASIVGLSLLMSSCMVFNFFKNLQEDVLTSLDSYVKFGQLALQNQDESSSSSSKPFQKLAFLIRDWNNPGEFPYGSKGGKGFLDQKLQVKPDQAPEAKAIRESIKNCFENLDCYLMPHPGDQAIMSDFKGSISELSVPFSKKLEDFISSLINPDDLGDTSVKNLFGNQVTAAEFRSLLDNYISIFNSKETPSPISLLEATVQVTTQSLLQKCLRKYQDSMKGYQRTKMYLKDEDLVKADKLSRNQALKLFKASKKFGSAEQQTELGEDLERMMGNQFRDTKKANHDKRSKYINSELESALKAYIEEMELEFSFDAEKPLEYHEESKITKRAKVIQNDALDDFLEKIGEDQEEESSLRKLRKELEDKMSGYLMEKVILENRNRLKTAENQLRCLMNKLADEYSGNLQKYLEDNPFLDISVDSKSLQADHEELLKGLMDKFSQDGSKFAPSGKKDPDFPGCRPTDFNDILGAVFTTLTNAHNVKLGEHKVATERIVEELAKMYKNDMEAAFITDLEELDEWHSNNISGFEGMFDQQCCLPKDSSIYQSNLAFLRRILNEIYREAFHELEEKEIAAQQQLKTAINESFNWYYNEMTKHLKSDPFILPDDLERVSTNFAKEAQKLFKDHPIPTVNMQNEGMEALIQKLEQSFAEMTLSQERNMELAKSTAKNLVAECHQVYQKEMKDCMEKVRSEEKLKEAHVAAHEQSEKAFKDKCEVKDDYFMEPYLEELKNENEEAFEEVLELFELKMGEQETITAGAIADARTMYDSEMEKHLNNQEFIRPDDLQKLHEAVSKVAVEKINKQTPLTQGQRAELVEALEEAFPKWKEQNDMNLDCEDIAIGIDLGTTYSCVAAYVGGKVRVIPNLQGKNTTPSYVAFNADGSETVGEPAKSRAYENPENTIFDAKRILGRKFADENLQNDMKYWAFTVEDDAGIPKICVRGKKLYPEQISAKILSEMKDSAEKFLMRPVKKAVITVPAYFSDGQRQATKDAGELAGFEVMMVLTEPVAAAMAYKKQHADTFGEEGGQHRNILIFDLGGGTFDVAVLKSKQGALETLAIDGDDHLGGEDFDRALMECCAKEFRKKHEIDLLSGRDSSQRQTRDDCRRRLKRLQMECERKKIELTSARRVEVSVDNMHGNIDLNVVVTRDVFEEMNEELFRKTIQGVESALKEAKMDKNNIHDIVLVGGSTRIPKIQEMLKSYFNGKALDYSINPDEAVAYGAAMKAAIMNGSITRENIDFTKIQDVTPMSMGVEIYGGGFSIIIPKSTKIPVKAKERYKTAHNNQTSVQVTIYQGEDEVALRNKHLGDFYLNGIPPRDAEVENIDVEMVINAQGILHVNAVCSSSGASTGIRVTENKQRMTRAVIQRLLDEASAA